MNSTQNSHYSLPAIRQAIAHFGIGKIVNGVLGLSIFLLIAQYLPSNEFRVYLIFSAIVSLSVNVSNIGIGVVGVAYIPKFRLQAGAARLFRFVLRLVGLRLLTLLICIGILYFAIDPLTGYFDIAPWRDAFTVYLLVVLFFGIVENLQLMVFEPLLLQGASQLTWLSRNLVFFGLLLAVTLSGDGTLHIQQVVYAEIFAAAAGVAMGLLQFFRYWRKQSKADTIAGEWRAPSARAMIELGGYDHASHLLQLSGSSNVLLLIAGKILDAPTMASFGFALRLAEQLRTYLPSQLLWKVIQPKLVASYTLDRDFSELKRRAGLLYKSSLFFLAPGLAVIALDGGRLLDLLSNGKYGDTRVMVAALLITLFPTSHKIVLWGVAITVEKTSAIAKGALSALVTGPLAILLLVLGSGPMGLVAAMMISAILHNAIVIYNFHRADLRYSLDLVGISKIGIAAAITVVCLAPVAHRIPSTITVLFVTFGLFALIVFLLKPLTEQEQRLIQRLTGR